MELAVLGNPESWYCRDLKRAAAERGHALYRLEFPTMEAAVGIPDAGVLETQGRDLGSLDALIVRTMPPGSLEQVVFRMDALARLQEEGVTVLNPPKAIECAVDKYLATARLQEAGLRVPATVVCERAESALAAFERMGGDLVVKPVFGSEGRGIVRVSDRELAWRTFRALERIGAVLYLQPYIDHGGSDVRVLVLDGRVRGAFRRRGGEDFRTNVANNGRAEPHRPSDIECETALRASAAIGTRLAGVDLLYDRRGQCYVVEVNAVPGWRAFGRVTGIDVAAAVIASLARGR